MTTNAPTTARFYRLSRWPLVSGVQDGQYLPGLVQMMCHGSCGVTRRAMNLLRIPCERQSVVSDHLGRKRKRQLPAETVERIRAERAGGASMAKIATGLNEDDVATSQGGAKWYPSTVKAVLDSMARESLEGFTVSPVETEGNQ